jgi:hypothetical protein
MLSTFSVLWAWAALTDKSIPQTAAKPISERLNMNSPKKEKIQSMENIANANHS